MTSSVSRSGGCGEPVSAQTSCSRGRHAARFPGGVLASHAPARRWISPQRAKAPCAPEQAFGARRGGCLVPGRRHPPLAFVRRRLAVVHGVLRARPSVGQRTVPTFRCAAPPSTRSDRGLPMWLAASQIWRETARSPPHDAPPVGSAAVLMMQARVIPRWGAVAGHFASFAFVCRPAHRRRAFGPLPAHRRHGHQRARVRLRRPHPPRRWRRDHGTQPRRADAADGDGGRARWGARRRRRGG